MRKGSRFSRQTQHPSHPYSLTVFTIYSMEYCKLLQIMLSYIFHNVTRNQPSLHPYLKLCSSTLVFFLGISSCLGIYLVLLLGQKFQIMSFSGTQFQSQHSSNRKGSKAYIFRLVSSQITNQLTTVQHSCFAILNFLCSRFVPPSPILWISHLNIAE